MITSSTGLCRTERGHESAAVSLKVVNTLLSRAADQLPQLAADASLVAKLVSLLSEALVVRLRGADKVSLWRSRAKLELASAALALLARLGSGQEKLPAAARSEPSMIIAHTRLGLIAA